MVGDYKQSCIVMVGDSIIKHIDPKKLSKNKMYKYTYPGDTAESISTKVCALKPQIAPSHVIIHAGTNNVPTDTADDCAQKVVNLAVMLKSVKIAVKHNPKARHQSGYQN